MTAAPIAEAAPSISPAPPVPGGMSDRVLGNRFAYIPAQCYVKTTDAAATHNACYPCHRQPREPNFVDDAELQVTWKFPGASAKNPWRNLFDPPVARQPRASDAEILAYVRTSNYVDARGELTLAARLRTIPAAWDVEGDHKWDGYVPDARFDFDPRGFDRGATGWRAFAYAPFPGAFLPTNGSADDVLIRLDAPFRQDTDGRFDQRIYELNLAVVEALITRADVTIDPVDERALGVDLDLDGRLATARKVTFDGRPGGATRMHYVGQAHAAEAGGALPIAPGLFPLGTEFLHSVRYLDVGPDGAVKMAARMKELRYAQKRRWLSYADLKAVAAADPVEATESADGARTILWQNDHGIANGQGWYFQGFIEAADGSLRPQSYEETVACAGCHGGIGATTDGIFAFPRKLGAAAPARGWFHWTQHDLRGIGERRDAGGEGEYSAYLRRNGAVDDWRENDEARARFTDGAGRWRVDALAALGKDVSPLVVPSAARALELDRAYRAIVIEQSFARGRDAFTAPARNVHEEAPAGKPTGLRAATVKARRRT